MNADELTRVTMPQLLFDIAPQLNLAGLILTTLAAVILALYPPRVPQYTKKGERVVEVVTWVTDAREPTWRHGHLQRLLSKLGPWLLVLGFALQLPNALKF